MSGDLDIRHGGAISVDTGALRTVSSRIARVAGLIDESREAMLRAYRIVVDQPGFSAHVDTVALWASVERAGDLRDDADGVSGGALLMADAYEVVELRAQADALAATDAVAAAALRDRAATMLDADDRLGPAVASLLAAWEATRFEGLAGQWNMAGTLPPFFAAGALIGLLGGVGRLTPGLRLGGTADAVMVAPVKASSPARPPTGLAEAFGRMPTSAGAQVRIERLTMPGGATRFVAYMQGTAFPPTYGGAEPWDMKSNTELYTGRRSASYQATLDALELAGAKPGDRVDVFAHSQSGMIGAHLAMESEYDVQMLVTAGSPVEPVLGEHQTLVQIVHTDDVVRSLAGGGSPGGTGSADSFIATRVGDPVDQVGDLSLDTHMLDRYVETAQMIDASSDPRAQAVDEYFAELAEAEVIESTEYRATRE